MDLEKAGCTISLDEFAIQHNLTLEIGERNLPTGHPARYDARFEACCISEPPLLKTVFGNGGTKEESIEELATQLESKTLVIDEARHIREKLSSRNFTNSRLKLNPALERPSSLPLAALTDC